MIPGLTQLVKDVVLSYLWHKLQMWLGSGCGVGWQLQLPFNPQPGNFHIPQVQPLKKKKLAEGAHWWLSGLRICIVSAVALVTAMAQV